MKYFNQTQKKTTVKLKFGIYAVILLVILFLFIPKYLSNKANKILENYVDFSKEEIDYPNPQVFTAYNLYKTVEFFPGNQEKSIEIQDKIFNYYYPKFKEDYQNLKNNSIENCIKLEKDTSKLNIDSLRMRIIQKDWTIYPDSTYLQEYLKNWTLYQKYFKKRLKNYYYIIDRRNPKLI